MRGFAAWTSGLAVLAVTGITQGELQAVRTAAVVARLTEGLAAGSRYTDNGQGGG